MLLNGLDTGAFLRDTWQQRPLLIRNPWSGWQNPLEPDELAGLACEGELESRLVLRAGDSWSLEHGPFAETRFGRLGPRDWTLLVQAVDHHVPEVAALIEPFRFIPDWRIDDVMVSYAADGGGVGPHFDNYDVFLVQGLGRRRWQIGAPCGADAALLPHDDLCLLEQFAPTEEWVLEPGDILYLPPRVPHNGVALGDDCMTYSVGFRAPARSELIARWCDEAIEDLCEDDRYADPGLPAQANPGEISAQALARLQEMVIERLADRDAFARWFGRHNSTPKYPEVDWRPEHALEIADVRAAIAAGAELCRNPASRLSFIARGPGAVWLFADGECFDCADEAAVFARHLCAQGSLKVDPGLAGSDAASALIAALCNQGSTAFADEDQSVM